MYLCLYLSVCLYVRLYVSLFFSMSLFFSFCLSVQLSASLFGNQSVRPVILRSTWGPYIYTFIYMYVYICVCVINTNKCIATLNLHTENVFAFIFSLEVQRHDALSSKLGTKGPQRGTVKLMCLSVRLFVCLSICQVICIAFW